MKKGNRLHPYYLAYVDMEGRPVVPHTDPKRILDMVRMAAKGRTEPILSLCDPFNTETKDGRDMVRYSDLLSAAIDTLVEREKGRALDSLFTAGAADLLPDGMGGLDDFELLCFFVVRAEA